MFQVDLLRISIMLSLLLMIDESRKDTLLRFLTINILKI